MSSLCWRLNLAVQILTTQRMRSPIKSKLQTLQVQVAFPSFNGGDSTTMADADCFTADGEGTLRCGVPRREWRRWATKAKKRPFGRGLLRGSWPVEHVETERNFPQGRSRINVDTPTKLRINYKIYIVQDFYGSLDVPRTKNSWTILELNRHWHVPYLIRSH